MNQCIQGLNGLRVDPLNGEYHPGHGYRTFSPSLRRFASPDDCSPFGVGGINPYAYCAGDPINQADPDGHHSVGGWLGIGVAMALGILLTPVSGGTSLAVGLSIASVTSAVASAGLAVAQQYLETRDPKTAAVLGWAALGAGIVSALSSLALSRVVPGVKSLISLVKGTSNRPLGGMMLQQGNAGGRVAQSGGQFRTPRLIGIYPAEEGHEGFFMAFSFTDRMEGNELRLNVVGPAAMTEHGNFAMGSGRWTGRTYERILMGSRSVATHIRDRMNAIPEISTVRLAVPYAGRSVTFPRVSGTFRAAVGRYVSNSGGGVTREVTLHAPYYEYSTQGPAAAIINHVMDGLVTDRFGGLFTVFGYPFSPDSAQGLLDEISRHYADTPGAFHIDFNPTE